MISINGLKKSFETPRGKVIVFDDFSLKVKDNTFLGIAGKSGAGKSTLLSMIAGLQKPDEGKIIIGTTDIFSLSDKKLCSFRNEHIGFVSQEQSFLENLTVLDNVRLPYYINSHKTKNNIEKKSSENIGEKNTRGNTFDFVTERASELLKKLAIEHLAKSYPRELSGGENHRVLIARALMNDPEIILADEPTESVDEKQTREIIKIFRKLSDDGKTVLLVSHDKAALKLCDKVVKL